MLSFNKAMVAGSLAIVAFAGQVNATTSDENSEVEQKVELSVVVPYTDFQVTPNFGSGTQTLDLDGFNVIQPTKFSYNYTIPSTWALSGYTIPDRNFIQGGTNAQKTMLEVEASVDSSSFVVLDETEVDINGNASDQQMGQVIVQVSDVNAIPLEAGRHTGSVTTIFGLITPDT